MEATKVKTQHQATKNRELTNTIDPLLMGYNFGHEICVCPGMGWIPRSVSSFNGSMRIQQYRMHWGGPTEWSTVMVDQQFLWPCSIAFLFVYPEAMATSLYIIIPVVSDNHPTITPIKAIL